MKAEIAILFLLFIVSQQISPKVFRNRHQYAELIKSRKDVHSGQPRRSNALFSNGNGQFLTPTHEHEKLAQDFQSSIYSLDAQGVLATVCDTVTFNHVHAEYNADGSPIMVNGTQLKVPTYLPNKAAVTYFLSQVFPLALNVCYYKKEKLEFHSQRRHHGVRGYSEFTSKDNNVLVRMGNGKSTNVAIFIPQVGSVEFESNNYEFGFDRPASGLCISDIYAYDRVFQAPAALKQQVWAETDPEQRCKLLFDYYETVKNAAFADTDKFSGY
jgi:hypothetical protein